MQNAKGNTYNNRKISTKTVIGFFWKEIIVFNTIPNEKDPSGENILENLLLIW